LASCRWGSDSSYTSWGYEEEKSRQKESTERRIRVYFCFSEQKREKKSREFIGPLMSGSINIRKFHNFLPSSNPTDRILTVSKKSNFKNNNFKIWLIKIRKGTHNSLKLPSYYQCNNPDPLSMIVWSIAIHENGCLDNIKTLVYLL
jgi:hypothetical protein